MEAIDDWVEWSWRDACDDSWAHHGLAALADGSIAAYHARDRAIVVFDRDGALRRLIPCEALEAHDIAVDGDRPWIADCGVKLGLDADRQVVELVTKDERAGQVLLVDTDGLVHLMTVDGARLLTIDDLDCPHGIVIDERGTEPRLCVADRGNRRVQVFDLDGRYVRTIGKASPARTASPPDPAAPCT